MSPRFGWGGGGAAALEEFCPRLSTPEELKRFYDAISPDMDPSGFTLYRMAKELTGIDVPSCFPYEDNRGLFEEMSGHSLLDWLTAVHFQAVDWDACSGPISISRFSSHWQKASWSWPPGCSFAWAINSQKVSGPTGAGTEQGNVRIAVAHIG